MTSSKLFSAKAAPVFLSLFLQVFLTGCFKAQTHDQSGASATFNVEMVKGKADV